MGIAGSHLDEEGCRHCVEAKKIREELAEARRDFESVKTRLFETLKNSGKFEEAEEEFRSIVGAPYQDGNSEAMLDLKYSFAEMQIERRMFEEAEEIAQSVLEQRSSYLDPLSDRVKASHRQVCSVRCHQKKFGDARRMHLAVYHRQPQDSWSLENGDEFCRVLREQGKHEGTELDNLKQALAQQDEILRLRQQSDGPRASETLKSGLQRASIIEALITAVGSQNSRNVQKERDNIYIQYLKVELKEGLSGIWNDRISLETNKNMLSVGHQLGALLYDEGIYQEAEAVLTDVWEGKKCISEETSDEAIATGSKLAFALHKQRIWEKNERAAIIWTSLWKTRKTTLGETHKKTQEIANNLRIVYNAISDFVRAEEICRWFLAITNTYTSNEDSAAAIWRYRLADALFEQGEAEYPEARKLYLHTYQIWRLEAT